MKLKSTGTVILLGSALLLSACSNEGATPEKNNDNQVTNDSQTSTMNEGSGSNGDSEETSAVNEESNGGSEEASAAEVNENGEEQNSDQSNDQNHAEGIEKQGYDSPEKAAAAVEYRKVEQTNLELGHDVNGFQEGATGHEYISWNEGRWLIQVNFPTDSQYAIEGYEGGDELAREVVDYLESHYLPAPKENGMIKINGFKDHPETVVKWQEKQTVYTITSKEDKPFAALEKAVESQS